MSENESGYEIQVGLYVLPSEPGIPPRTWVGPVVVTPDGEQFPAPGGEGSILTWSRDLGVWLDTNGTPAPEDLGKVATEHAKELGVEW